MPARTPIAKAASVHAANDDPAEVEQPGRERARPGNEGEVGVGDVGLVVPGQQHAESSGERRPLRPRARPAWRPPSAIGRRPGSRRSGRFRSRTHGPAPVVRRTPRSAQAPAGGRTHLSEYVFVVSKMMIRLEQAAEPTDGRRSQRRTRGAAKGPRSTATPPVLRGRPPRRPARPGDAAR